MIRRRTIAVALLTASSLISPLAAQDNPVHHRHHRYRHERHLHEVAPDEQQGQFGPRLGPAYQPNTSGTNNNGYVYNPEGYGRFVQGPDGSFGGYPLGSAGAEELMNQQREKCEAVPEEC